MPNQDSQKLLRELKKKNEVYAQKSTQLSELLDEAERFLNGLSAKMSISVAESDWDRLVFMRSAVGWKLWYGSGDEGSWVTEGSVSVKAAAAQLLPELFDRLVSTQDEKLGEVEIALKALSSLPYLKADRTGGAQ